MRKYKAVLALSVLLVLGPARRNHAQVSGFDQVGTTAFQFLKVIPNARAAAMGGLGTLTIQSSEAVFFNPASIAAGRSTLDMGVSYLDWFLDVRLTSFSLSYKLADIGTIGFHALYNDLGDFEETSVDGLFRDEATGAYNPGTTGNILSPNAFVAGISFAKSLTDKFIFGVTAKYAREDLVAAAASGLIFDGGIRYDTGFKTLQIGATLRNFGAEIKYLKESYPLPQTLSIGAAGYLVGPENPLLASSPVHRLLVAYDLSQTRDHSQQQHFGVEYSLSDFIFLRGGYKFNFDEEGLTLGFGLKRNGLAIDYAYNDFGEFLGNVQRFTLGFSIQ